MDRDKLQTAVGLRIKQLREERGYSQEHFAHSIKMDRSYFASVEVGRRNVTLRNLAKIAHGFGISLSELFEGLEIPPGYFDDRGTRACLSLAYSKQPSKYDYEAVSLPLASKNPNSQTVE